MTITGPAVHKGLSIFFIHGISRDGKVPLTLQEALLKGKVRIEETGHVNELVIENIGDEEVFIQAGDVVKGGRQDRVLAVSMLLAARSGKVPIASFCVEQGRWARRAKEDVTKFSESSVSYAPRGAARMAMMTYAASFSPAERRYRNGAVGEGQGEVWKAVAETQGKLARSVGAPVVAAASPSSLQLSMEAESVRDAKAEYVAKLTAAGREGGDITGVVFAINGRVTGAESYPWSGLFEKMWEKNLAARITEALGEENAARVEAVDAEGVASFLADADGGARTVNALPVGAVAEQTGRTSRMQEALADSGAWVHRSYLRTAD